MVKENWGPEKIREFPGDRTEASWLDAIEYLRQSLSESMGTSVQVGCYWIDDFPNHGGASCVARVRGREPIAGILSDSWEGLLLWSGSRGKHGNAAVVAFPFLNGSVVQQRGRLADLEQDVEADELLSYRFETGTFIFDGWVNEDGPGEWAGVNSPGDVYWQKLKLIDTQRTFAAREPIKVSLSLPNPITKSQFNTARISLIHVNRNRENTNLVPWTVRPPKKVVAGRVLPGGAGKLMTPNTFQIHLDQFSIRGGWIPGDYYLSVRIQNCSAPASWSWTCDISEPIKITIV